MVPYITSNVWRGERNVLGMYCRTRGDMTRTYHSRRLRAMHAAHGVTEGRKCGECKHYRMLGMWCELNTSGSTQWATNWAACGAWETRA